MRLFKYLLVIFIASGMSCKDSYDVPGNAARTNTLVVEGVINASGNTRIVLSRSAALADTSRIVAEQNAQVSVESDNGQVIPLVNVSDGNYEGETVTDPSAKYRVHIRTVDGREYASDMVPVLLGPQIDSISFAKHNGDVVVYANTHDPSNNTRYYRWSYTEDWEFHAAFSSYFEYKNGSVVFRTNTNIYTCYQSDYSREINIASSAKLENDIISLAPINVIPNGSERISVLYSINVTQYPLTRDAYEYWDQLKKNTEKLGSIFDPQPSANKTNIRCISDPNEIVIGYISASSMYTRRLFIYNQEVQPWAYGTDCQEYEVTPDSFEFFFGSKVYEPTRQGSRGSFNNPSYYGATSYCMDCTLSGTNVKPSFWPR